MPGYSDSENYYGVPQSSLGVPQIIADPQGFAETPPPMMITPDPRGGFNPSPHYNASQQLYFNIPFGTTPADRSYLMRPVIANQQRQLQLAGVPDSDPRMRALNTALSIHGARDDYSSLPEYPKGYINIPQTDAYDYITPSERVYNWATAGDSTQQDYINNSGMTLEEAEDIVRRYYTPTSPETAYTPPPATYPLSRLRDVIYASNSGMSYPPEADASF